MDPSGLGYRNGNGGGGSARGSGGALSAAQAIELGRVWIQRELFHELPKLAGDVNARKFIAALKKGLVGPVGEQGIKQLERAVSEDTHELKINGSAARILGKLENGVLVFEKFVGHGLR